MRTCEERTRDVLERRRAVVANRRRRGRRIALGMLCAVVAVGITVHVIPKPGSTIDTTPDEPRIYEEYHELYEYVKEHIGNIKFTGVDKEVLETWPTQAGTSSGSSEDSGGVDVNLTVKNEAYYSAITEKEHSDTNLQVAGVQEADIVKTDGRYIYALSKAMLTIVEVDNGKLSKVAELALEQNGYAESMYITDNRLVVERGDVKIGDTVWNTFVEVYDITDRTAPRLLNDFGQSGYRVTSRMVGDVLYTVSEYSIYKTPAEDQITTYVPSVCVDDVVAPLAVKDILVCSSDSAVCTYMVVSGFDTAAVRQISQKSLLGYGDIVYCNTENLYLAGYTHIETENSRINATQLHRFSLNDGDIRLEATGTVEGSLLNQFSMDEYEGHLRLVTTKSGTIWKEDAATATVTATNIATSQNLYVLDDDLTIVGQIDDLAPGERVYSVRFTGDIGYFVTFRQTDPLFAADLSDPKQPKILSALKIPGFSEYLHPFTDDLLLGLGRDADENGVQSGSLKLSMFDVSDPADVTEAHTLLLEDCHYSVAEYDHRAILVDAQRNLIAFPGSGDTYLIYGFTEDEGFAPRASLHIVMGDNSRGLYIGDYFYVVTTGTVYAFDMTDFTPVDQLPLTVS